MSSSSELLRLHGIELPEKSVVTISQLLGSPIDLRAFVYPWDGLESYLAASTVGPHLPLVGYGSLVSPASALRTLKHPVSLQRSSVIAFGVKRVFNYRMTDSVCANYGQPTNPLARAALNAYATGNLTDVLNGVLVPIHVSDVPGLRQREAGYDLLPVWCLSWDQPHAPPLLAYLLCSPDEARQGTRWTDDGLLPHFNYFELCRVAAAAVGEQFLSFFLETTFLGDRRTPVVAREVEDSP